MTQLIPIKCTGAHHDFHKKVDYYIVVVYSYYRIPQIHHEWCVNTFGEPGEFTNTEICRWHTDGPRFYFFNEEDYNWFILRWS